MKTLHVTRAALALSALALIGCSSGTDPGAPPTTTLQLQGRIDLTGFDGSAGKAGEFWLVALAPSDEVASAQRLVPDPVLLAPFDLEVTAGTDGVLAVRADDLDGPHLAAFRPGGAQDPRTVFTIPASGDVDLGTLTLIPDTPWLASDLGVTLPPPDTDYRDLDRDLLPDLFDRDDDDDGLPDREDPLPDIVLFSLDGGLLMMDTPHGTWRTVYWLTGQRNTRTGTLTLDPAAAPRIGFQASVDYPLHLAGFEAWVDSVPAVFDPGGALAQGNLRFGSYGSVRLSPVDDSDGAGTPGFLIRQTGLRFPDSDTCLTCGEFAGVGDALATGDEFVVMAWSGLQGATRLQAMTRAVMDAYAWCLSHKQELTDAREFQGRDVVVEGDILPGDATAGTAAYGWQNEDENPTINPGDSFTAVFEHYWRNRPDRTVDFILDGTIEIRHYIDRRDLPHRILMGADCVVIRDLRLTPTRRTGPDVKPAPGEGVTFNSYRQDMTDGGPAYWVEF